MNHFLKYDNDLQSLEVEIDGDNAFLEKVLELLVQRGSHKEIFFLFRREDEILLNDEELDCYRTLIPSLFNECGKYNIIRKRNDHVFDSFAKHEINDQIISTIKYSLLYFYSMAFFVPNEDFSFEKMVADSKTLINYNVYGIYALTEKYCDYYCMKGFAKDSIIVSCKTGECHGILEELSQL